MASSTMDTPGLFAPVQAFFRRFAVSFKLAGILLLTLLLQIPLFMIKGLLDERLLRREQAVSEITSTWGLSQTLTGPILVIPYTTSYATENNAVINGRVVRTTEEKTRLAYAFFLPEALEIDGELNPSVRHRGIYEAAVYSGALRLRGHFGKIDVRALGLDPASFKWDQAWIALGVSDLRGTREALRLKWNDAAVDLEPSTRIQGLDTGLHARLPGLLSAERERQEFSCELTLNGSEQMTFVPVGKQTQVKLRSTWADPSFTGAMLPTERQVSPSGFEAAWQVSYYGRSFPQQWTEAPDGTDPLVGKLAAAAFGVSLMTPVDNYRVVERAIKYGVLFITLLFTAFFLFEVLAALRLHPIHYLLVGAALCLFYLALLSTSEFLSFPTAYTCAATASTLLIGSYCRSILRSGRRSLAIVGALVGIYAFLFFVLQMQDYALLAGTAGLFAVLGTVMYATRKVDWAGQAPTQTPVAVQTV